MYGLDEAAEELLSRASETSQWFPSPEQRKQSYLRAIRGLWVVAESVRLQKTRELSKQAELKHFLEEAELDWHQLFLDEKRFALDSLRLEVVAHHLQRAALVFPGERARLVESYSREQLMPRIRLFLSKQRIQLKRISGDGMDSVTLSKGSYDPETESKNILPQAMVLALPNAAIAVPGLWSCFDPKFIPSLPNPVPGVGPGEQPLNPLKVLRWSTDKISHDTREWAEPLITDIGNATISGINGLLNFLVLAQAGAVIGSMIQGGIAVYSGIALREAEQTIKELLDNCQKRWPAISKKMEEAVNLPGPSGESLQKAENILSTINQSVKPISLI